MILSNPTNISPLPSPRSVSGKRLAISEALKVAPLSMKSVLASYNVSHQQKLHAG